MKETLPALRAQVGWTKMDQSMFFMSSGRRQEAGELTKSTSLTWCCVAMHGANVAAAVLLGSPLELLARATGPRRRRTSEDEFAGEDGCDQQELERAFQRDCGKFFAQGSPLLQRLVFCVALTPQGNSKFPF